jgi:hypothetical protein
MEHAHVRMPLTDRARSIACVICVCTQLGGIRVAQLTIANYVADPSNNVSSTVAFIVNGVCVLCVSGVTLGFNSLLRELIIILTKRAGHDTLTAQQGVRAGGCWLLAAGCWLLAAWLLAAGCWLVGKC